ncbi:MAG: lamin tail domain-containing protein [Proteobacteria bacterium]|nr:lamin tail domain-containing protein [Pseudomonadota bacterium]
MTRRPVVACAALLAAFNLLCIACGAAVAPQGDFRAPRIVAVSLGDDEPLSPTAAITVDFSEAVEAALALVDLVAIVPHALGAGCSVDLGCGGGACFAGRCQASPVDGAWLADFAHPPLTAGRAAATAPIRVELLAGGERLRVQPALPLAPGRLHTLLVASGWIDGAGHRLALEPDLPVASRRVFATGDVDRARPVLELLAPLPASTDVAPNLKRLVVRFSHAVAPLDLGSLWLAAANGRRVALRPLAETGPCAAASVQDCHWLAVTEALPALTVWSLRAAPGLSDAQGATLLQEQGIELATSALLDTTPPALGEVRLVQADGCVVVRTRSSEAADARLSASWTGSVQRSAGVLAHELALAVPAAPAAGAQLRLDLRDGAGQAAASWLHRIDLAPIAPLVIAEVLADPLGADPDQEWVELYNRSERAVDLDGWALRDLDGGSEGGALPALRVAPHGYVLVVGPRYRPGSGPDPFPAESVPLARLRSPLGGRGLPNRGDPVFLFGPDGVLASSASGRVGVAAETPGPGRSV